MKKKILLIMLFICTIASLSGIKSVNAQVISKSNVSSDQSEQKQLDRYYKKLAKSKLKTVKETKSFLKLEKKSNHKYGKRYFKGNVRFYKNIGKHGLYNIQKKAITKGLPNFLAVIKSKKIINGEAYYQVYSHSHLLGWTKAENIRFAYSMIGNIINPLSFE
ncbi:hypothetical protein [Pediococcus argentinicus]|uniref:Uncharacterized protein n=1 Tax=Pediococcus argentinicus TaxID=480391 RepID=A0A0R2NJD7_9LACO|nr:hypothetical protein [Pediococcus argentinicus]KRO25905.1 hypothetical protein IV88_GL001440 [Pediococcus argentinicus]NKZ21898.1 hypothetical protein [Pediococcus argentinicus]GEP19068.1 hypothetical protein LSA03_04520 [Pediococcus argentinicus]